MEIGNLQNAVQALAATPAAGDASKIAENRDLIQAVKAINGAEMFGQDNELTFLMDRNTHRPVIRIVNRKTNEVVRQLPPEYVLRVAEEMARNEE